MGHFRRQTALSSARAAGYDDFDERKKDAKVKSWRKELGEGLGPASFGPDPASLEIEAALLRWLAERIPAQQDLPRVAYWLGRPPSLGDFFVGRGPAFDDLVKALRDCGVIVITGPPALGR